MKAHFDQEARNLLLDNQELHIMEHALVEDDNEIYISVSNLLLMLYINQQASISGMINPTIHFKTAQVQLDQEGVDFNAQEFYQGMLSYHMPKFTKKSFITYIKPEYADFIPITIQVPEAKDGEVYALIQPVVRPSGLTPEMWTSCM